MERLQCACRFVGDRGKLIFVTFKHRPQVWRAYCQTANLRYKTRIKEQIFLGNSSKFNLAHILRLGRPQCETNCSIVRLAKYRLVFEKINNNRILRNICHGLSLQFRSKKNALRNKITHSREIKSTKSCRMMPKYVLKLNWAIIFYLLWKYNYISLFYQDEN